MNRQELINSLIKDTQDVKREVSRIVELGDDALNYKPSINRWSALECLEHLNIADAHYLYQFDQKLPVASKSERDDFKPGLLGNYFVKMIKPKADRSIPNPMKTFQKFRPEITTQHDTIHKFLEDQDTLIAYLGKSKDLDLNKIKITSAIGKIITFKLGDAFRFLIGHNQRHVIQMQNVIQEVEGVSIY